MSLVGDVDDQLGTDGVVDDPVNVVKVGIVDGNGLTSVGRQVDSPSCLAIATCLGR